MTEAKILLGKRIRSLRRSKDYSQEEFAELAEISGKYLGEIERGQAELWSRVVYGKLGGDPFFLNSIHKFDSINYFCQPFRTMKTNPSSLGTLAEFKCHGDYR